MAKHSWNFRRYGDHAIVDGWVKRVDNLYKHYGRMQPWEFNWEIFQRGIVATENELQQEGKLTDPVVVELRRIGAARREQAGLLDIYDELGEPRFVEFCEANGLDPEPTIKRARKGLDDRDRRILEQRWLDDFLDDGQAYETNEIRRQAVRDGVFHEDDEVAWHRMENYASRKRYTVNSPRGQWCKVGYEFHNSVIPWKYYIQGYMYCICNSVELWNSRICTPLEEET